MHLLLSCPSPFPASIGDAGLLSLTHCVISLPFQHRSVMRDWPLPALCPTLGSSISGTLCLRRCFVSRHNSIFSLLLFSLSLSLSLSLSEATLTMLLTSHLPLVTMKGLNTLRWASVLWKVDLNGYQSSPMADTAEYREFLAFLIGTKHCRVLQYPRHKKQ